MSLSEIAAKTGLNAGTCANIIKTLVARNYLEKVGRFEGYRIGRKMYGITGESSKNELLIEASLAQMQALTGKLNENTLLCVLSGDKRIVIKRIQSDNELQANTAKEKKVWDTASGRLLVAMLEEEELHQFIESFGLPTKQEWADAAGMKSFQQSIKLIRKQGYSIQVTKEHILGIAFPVYAKGKVVASLGMYMPESRCNASGIKEIISLIKKSAKIISRSLQ